MKKQGLMLTGLFALLSLNTAHAGVLYGNVTGFGVLSCVMTNTTGSAQVVDQVQYQYTCNHGPHDPFHMYFTVVPCFGSCEVENGQTFWHNNGPWTNNCMMISADCQGWTHPAPTPVPTATPVNPEG